jgi:hypothetical protein
VRVGCAERALVGVLVSAVEAATAIIDPVVVVGSDDCRAPSSDRVAAPPVVVATAAPTSARAAMGLP